MTICFWPMYLVNFGIWSYWFAGEPLLDFNFTFATVWSFLQMFVVNEHG